MICTAHKYYFGVKIEKNEIGRPCSTYGGRGELHIGCLWENRKERDHLEDRGINGRIILKLFFRKWVGGHGLDLSGSE